MATSTAGAGPAPGTERLRREVADVPREIARSIGFDADQFVQLHHLLTGLIENLDGAGSPA